MWDSAKYLLDLFHDSQCHPFIRWSHMDVVPADFFSIRYLARNVPVLSLRSLLEGTSTGCRGCPFG